ncbi:MAG: flagellar export chaperone FlgN [Pirellulales bacterium]|nr:flagellar export chaperone FlgN [Pirellulales bacterium]
MLTELSDSQDELFAILAKKRSMLLASDHAGLTSLFPAEERLLEKMKACATKRETLLIRARKEGMPSQSIASLSNALPASRRGDLPERIVQANARTRLLQNQSITNWIVIQRTLIHLSQMLEIIATGGRLQPTYGEGEPVNASGSLVDRAA